MLRLRAQEAEKERVGLPAMEAAMETDLERSEEAEDTLAACPPTLNVLAARLVAALSIEAAGGTTLSDELPIKWTLETIRPFLSGVILRDVSEILDNADNPLEAVFDSWFGPVWREEAREAA